jgi:hypothetical protein
MAKSEQGAVAGNAPDTYISKESYYKEVDPLIHTPKCAIWPSCWVTFRISCQVQIFLILYNAGDIVILMYRRDSFNHRNPTMG